MVGVGDGPGCLAGAYFHFARGCMIVVCARDCGTKHALTIHVITTWHVAHNYLKSHVWRAAHVIVEQNTQGTQHVIRTNQLWLKLSN